MSWTALALTLAVLGAPLREVDLRLPSESAGPAGLALRVCLPRTPRYGEQAPVAVVVPPGWDDSRTSRLLVPLAAAGFIEVRCCFPGEGAGDARSGGTADLRGPAALAALADVLAFAAGQTRSTDGLTLAQLAAPLRPAPNLGLMALAHGGSQALLTLARYPAAARATSWLATWETPLGDAATLGLQGTRASGPNPAYDPATGVWDSASLAYDPTLRVGGTVGGFYQDTNRNGRRDAAEYVLRPLPRPNGDTGVSLLYPLAVLRAAEERRLLPKRRPDNLPSLADAQAFWRDRDAVAAVPVVAAQRPELLVEVLGATPDHWLAAAEAPHLGQLYGLWRAAGLAWVRLNPEAAYVAALAGDTETRDYTALPANVDVPRAALAARLPASGLCPAGLLCAAAACELADRVRGGERALELGRLLAPTPRLRGAEGVSRPTTN